MVVRHHVRDHERQDYHVSDYNRGHGQRVQPFSGSGASSGRLSYGQRQSLPNSDFAVVLKSGERKYPIDTENRARSALARVDKWGSPEEKDAVRKAVHDRYPNIQMSKPPADPPKADPPPKSDPPPKADPPAEKRPGFFSRFSQSLGSRVQNARQQRAERKEAEKNIRAAVRVEEEAKADEEFRAARLKRIEEQERVRATQGGFFRRSFNAAAARGRSELTTRWRAAVSKPKKARTKRRRSSSGGDIWYGKKTPYDRTKKKATKRRKSRSSGNLWYG